VSTTTSVMSDLLLIKSFNLNDLLEGYRGFFLDLLPTVFMLAVLIEYLDRLQPFALLKRAFIAILILTSISTIYFTGIDYSMQAADAALAKFGGNNVVLKGMVEGLSFVKDIEQKSVTLKSSNIADYIKYHLFDRYVNDAFMLWVYFISTLCFWVLKGVYSLAYYLGYGLMGIPCLIYLFPTMSNVMRGGIITYLWCLVVPHIIVFILIMLGDEIEHGYSAGQVIGGSLEGTIILSFLALMLVGSLMIGMMILNGSGVGQALGVFSGMAVNSVMNIPASGISAGAALLTGGALGPKLNLASNVAKGGYRFASDLKARRDQITPSQFYAGATGNLPPTEHQASGHFNSSVANNRSANKGDKNDADDSYSLASGIKRQDGISHSQYLVSGLKHINNSAPNLSRGSHEQVSRPNSVNQRDRQTAQKDHVGGASLQPNSVGANRVASAPNHSKSKALNVVRRMPSGYEGHFFRQRR